MLTGQHVQFKLGIGAPPNIANMVLKAAELLVVVNEACI